MAPSSLSAPHLKAGFGISHFCPAKASDTKCNAAIDDCTDPFDVCAFYEGPSAPAPVCIQEVGTCIISVSWHMPSPILCRAVPAFRAAEYKLAI